MRVEKKRLLERAGWKVGDAGDFLGLSAEQRRFIEAKLALAAGTWIAGRPRPIIFDYYGIDVEDLEAKGGGILPAAGSGPGSHHA